MLVSRYARLPYPKGIHLRMTVSANYYCKSSPSATTIDLHKANFIKFLKDKKEKKK